MVLALDPDADNEERKGDMTPLIDLVFLLLVFFILTTRFIEDEKVLRQLLDTQNGNPTQPSITEPRDVKFRVYPSGIHHSTSIAALNTFASRSPAAFDELTFTIGGETLLIDPHGPEHQQMERIHGFVSEHLQKYELGGNRTNQDPIVIHAFSGLQWRYAMWAYDAIRDYELQRLPPGATVDRLTGHMGERQVSFAPPRIRNYSNLERGKELREIMVMQ